MFVNQGALPGSEGSDTRANVVGAGLILVFIGEQGGLLDVRAGAGERQTPLRYRRRIPLYALRSQPQLWA